MKTKRIKSIEKAVLISLILSFILPIIDFINNCENISNKVIRLHILANSDTGVDQNLKLLVRDKILASSNLFLDKDDNTLEKAEEKFKNNISKIESIAQREVYNNGFDYDVHAEIVNMYFNTRQYNNFTMPSGNYKALRITIGSGKGKNWWCVMFPPLCISAAEEHTTELDDVLTEPEREVLNEKYEIKFKIVELFELIKNIVCSLF